MIFFKKTRHKEQEKLLGQTLMFLRARLEGFTMMSDDNDPLRIKRNTLLKKVENIANKREIHEEDEPIAKEHFLDADSMKELLDINMECRRIWSNDMFQSDLDFDKENTPMKFLIK